MSDDDNQDKSLSDRFNTSVTSSLGLTPEEDKLINASNAVGEDIGFIGRADHFGYGDQLRKLKTDIQKKKDKFLRDITRMSLAQTIQFAQDTIDGFTEEATRWRNKQSKTLDLIVEFEQALPGAKEACDNDDLARDENGQYVNKDAQTVTEAVLATEGKTKDEMKNLSDKQAKAKLDYGINHSGEVAQSLSDKSELEGGTAETLEKAARTLKEALTNISNDPKLTDAQKKEAIYQRTMDAQDDVVKELRDMGLEDELIQEVVQDVSIEKREPSVVSEGSDPFLSTLGR